MSTDLSRSNDEVIIFCCYVISVRSHSLVNTMLMSLREVVRLYDDGTAFAALLGLEYRCENGGLVTSAFC